MEKAASRRVQSALLLTFCAFLWGTTFIAQKQGADCVGPFTFNCMRSLLSAVCLTPLAIFVNLRIQNERTEGLSVSRRAFAADKSPATVLLSGLICGLLLFAAMNFQQSGLAGSTAGKSAFLSSIYILMVPIFNLLLFRQKTGKGIIVSLAIAVAGLYLLCVKAGESFALVPSDSMLLTCAAIFALHIVIVGRFAGRINGIMLSCLQFWTVAVMSSVPMLIFERPTAKMLGMAAGAIAYAGILSGAVAYTLQIIGQQHSDPTVASMVMSLESVFSAAAGAVILGERMDKREVIGCLLIFASIIISQFGFEGFGRKKTDSTVSQ
ncbi:MAG: DMT family transporter [Clostridiales bacterium]|nr:DMT family transporter [Clostridiales bacterium]